MADSDANQRVLKRWHGWPQGTRWLIGGIAAVVLAAVMSWVLVVPAADWLGGHDVGSVRGPLLQTARDAAQGRLLTLSAGLFAAAALLFTARNFVLSREGQVTDRYTKAVEQLGSDKLDVRIGGIYALERIARDSPRDHPTVAEVLAAFIREHSHQPWPLYEHADAAVPERATRPDVQAALTVLRRRDVEHDRWPIDLSGAKLPRADLRKADFNGANLYRADLSGADLNEAKLKDATLDSAILNDANLNGIDLRDACLQGARLNGDTYLHHADLRGAELRGADLRGAHLRNADLAGAHFTGAHFAGAHLAGAHLRGANLCGADLHGIRLRGVDFAGADLSGARWPEGPTAPDGWKLNADSGLLEAADTDAEPVEGTKPASTSLRDPAP
jgi:uncharacterized protein YjbI with pentapeptide repeats